MPEVLDRPSEGIEAKERCRLIPTGIDRVPTLNGLATVIRGKTEDGKDIAIVLGPDQPPLELILGDDDSREADSFLASMMRSDFAKVAGGVLSLGAALTGVAAAGTTLMNCGGDSDNSNHDGAAFGTNSGALSIDQMMGNVKGEPALWTEWGDHSTGNFAVFGGKNYVFFNWSGSSPNGLFYIECTELIQCFDASAKRQTVEGFQEAQLGGPFKGAKIFKDQAGKDRFQVQPGGGGVNEGDITIDPATGNLKVSNMKAVVPPMTGGSTYKDSSGVPHAVYGEDKFGYDRNLHNGNETYLPDTNSGTYEDCGVPTMDGNLTIASKLTTISGVKNCSLVMGGTLNEVITKATSIVSLNSQISGSKKRLTDPRLATLPDGSGILIYSVLGPLPTNPSATDTRIWYALIPKPATPIDNDATGGDTTDTPDIVTPPPDIPETPDIPTVTDTGTEDPDVVVEPDVPTAEDVGEVIPDLGPTPEDTATVDAAAEITAQDVLDALEAAGVDVDINDLADLFDGEPELPTEPDVQPEADVPPTPDIPPEPDVPKPDTKDTAAPDTPPPIPDVPLTPDIPPEPDVPPALDTSPQKPDAGNAEPGNSADAHSGPDATITNLPKPGDGGCQGAPASIPVKSKIPAAILMLFNALSIYFRRRHREIRE